MSEAQTVIKTPTVYFIDDSATMREVIKIAFRKENIHIVACPDAATALAQFGETAPDAVITDVIMPGKDGYEVCKFIRQHERFGGIPVILMSGVVDRTVAERATEVKADELIRKPFQPLDLLARVKTLLRPKSSIVTNFSAEDENASSAPRAMAPALAGLFSGGPMQATAKPPAPAMAAPAAAASPAVSAYPSPQPASTPLELQKLRHEIWRLELLVKKLHAELEAEHQYCAALESHFKAMQKSD